MKKIISILITLCLPIIVNAADITKDVNIMVDNKTASTKIADNKENTYIELNDNLITIESPKDIYSIYIIYEYSSQTGTITSDNKSISIGENNFLHEYIPIYDKIGSTNKVDIKYDTKVKIADIYVFDDDSLPSYVEIWEKPCEEVDLMLLSTHSDDEQLFFLGLLPTYISRKADVQVVYFTNHYDNPKRLHEQLHGLYTVGIRHYPIIGIVPDAWSTTIEGALNNAKKAGLSEDDMVSHITDIIRRFKPQVIVGHDENGEYEHGQHMLNTYILKKALEKTNNPEYNISSYKEYGLWEVKKVYLHLYKDNQITMDYDTPLKYFNGKTAYEISKEGYSKHLSQQFTWFTKWINGENNDLTKATQIKTYSPLSFGLYYSCVGEDINKNDMLENIVLRKDIKKEDPIIEPHSEEKPQIYQENKLVPYRPYILGGTIIVGFILILLIKKH